MSRTRNPANFPAAFAEDRLPQTDFALLTGPVFPFARLADAERR